MREPVRDILAVVKSKQDFALELNCVPDQLQPQFIRVVMPPTTDTPQH